jgi:hypothetical protein
VGHGDDELAESAEAVFSADAPQLIQSDFKKNAQNISGKPLRETADIFYDTDHAESNVVRTRIQSPVDLGRSVGR